MNFAAAVGQSATKSVSNSLMGRILILLFFFLMLVLPTTFQLQRGLLLSVLVIGASFAARIRWRVAQDILLLWMITLVMGGIYILWGYVNNAPGALRISTVFILWPILYMLLVGLIHHPNTIVLFEKVLVAGIAVSALMAMALLIGAVAGHARDISNFFAFQGANIGLYGNYIELTSYNLATVIYGLPFLTALFFSPHHHGWLRHRSKVGLVFLLVVAICAVSGRRAFWLLALVTPVLVWGLFFLADVHFKGRYVIISAAFAIAIAIGGVVWLKLDFSILFEQLQSAFDFSQEQAARIRYQQFNALISGWSDSPLFGQGLGASANSFIRSKEMPWSYELSYVALLFQTGLFGVIMYSAAVLWIFYTGINIVRIHPDAIQVILPLLAGLAGFLLVNVTNPYLMKFDYLWTIFLPVAAINAYKTEKW